MFKILMLALLPLLGVANFSPNYNLEFFNFSPFPDLYRRNYTAFTCWLSCKDRATVMCHYLGFEDTGNADRPSSFTYDPVVPRSCQQSTTGSYNAIQAGWDRGHMVAANHMDENTTTIKESMHLTNIMPQTAILNRGAYLAAEEVFECWRDIVNLNTIVGIIMGDNDKNDHFVDSHGVKTPDYYWRIIEKEKDRDVIAWIFPNDETAVRGNLDKYLVRISDIESKTGFVFTQFTLSQKNKLANVSWIIPENCDKSRLARLRDDGNQEPRIFSILKNLEK